MYARGRGDAKEKEREAARCLECGCVAVATRFSAEITVRKKSPYNLLLQPKSMQRIICVLFGVGVAALLLCNLHVNMCLFSCLLATTHTPIHTDTHTHANSRQTPNDFV